jgi:hypothetical protein
MLPGRQLAAARRCQNLAAFVDHLSPTDRDDGPAGDLPARKDGEFGVRQPVLIANRSLQVGIYKGAARVDRRDQGTAVESKRHGGFEDCQGPQDRSCLRLPSAWRARVVFGEGGITEAAEALH